MGWREGENQSKSRPRPPIPRHFFPFLFSLLSCFPLSHLLTHLLSLLFSSCLLQKGRRGEFEIHFIDKANNAGFLRLQFPSVWFGWWSNDSIRFCIYCICTSKKVSTLSLFCSKTLFLLEETALFTFPFCRTWGWRWTFYFLLPFPSFDQNVEILDPIHSLIQYR